MKQLYVNLKKQTRLLIQDESGQGTTEYILILVGIVAIATMFGREIKGILTKKIGKIGQRVSGFTL